MIKTALGWVLFLIYVFVGNTHVTQCYRDLDSRNKTKPFPVLVLILMYFVEAHPVQWVLLVALVASWLGDILLIPKGNRWFCAGGISFAIAHVCFMLIYLPNIALDAVKLSIFVFPAVIYMIFTVLTMLEVKPDTPKVMRYAMAFYLITNSTMNLFALAQLVALKNFGAALAYLGAVLFFISDCCLYLVRYSERPEMVYKKHYTVMGTYLTALAFIVMGMLELQ